MPSSLSHRLDATISSLTRRYPGPGGAIAVLHEGRVVAQRCWGYASLEQRLPFTPSSLFRICSITKQFTCGVMLDRYHDPDILTPYIRKRLPHLSQPHPTIYHLAHNQSGLRDYWALAMLHGAAIEGSFSPGNSRHLINGTRSLHFSPGTSYSYVNQNFRLISEAMEDESGLPFSELLRCHIFEKAHMKQAFLAADTRAMPDGTTGYEGTEETGYRPALNRIYWTGDAGIGASLNDMIAWETFIDSQRHDPQGLYNRLSAPVSFSDGHEASYGFGLQRLTIAGHHLTAHSGALRGWRSCRLHCAAERLSIIVFFNHMSPAQLAATHLFKSFLGCDDTLPPPRFFTPTPFHGLWMEPSTGLSARIDPHESGVRLRYLMVPEMLTFQNPHVAKGAGVTLTYDEGCIHMSRPSENRSSILIPHEQNITECPTDLEGHYTCQELEHSELQIQAQGGILYGGFSGYLGEGRMERLTPLGRDVWAFPCPRALDHTAPGDWTLSCEREQGEITQIRVGCWLARNLIYKRTPTILS